MEKTSLTTA